MIGDRVEIETADVVHDAAVIVVVVPVDAQDHAALPSAVRGAEDLPRVVSVDDTVGSLEALMTEDHAREIRFGDRPLQPCKLLIGNISF